MGLPAARIGDTYAMHTDMILTGSPNVLVNGRGIHRVMDIFMCPIVGIGMTVMGSQTVKVNNQFAARVMGVGICAGQNLIATGSQDVSIGG
jgi:uncharacterized Zn-binding protein involved in type VI secretion